MDQQPGQPSPPPKKPGYGKRPLWQWIVIYLIIGAIVYAAIYYFVISKRGGYNTTGGGNQNTSRSLY